MNTESREKTTSPSAQSCNTVHEEGSYLPPPIIPVPKEVNFRVIQAHLQSTGFVRYLGGHLDSL